MVRPHGSVRDLMREPVFRRGVLIGAGPAQASRDSARWLLPGCDAIALAATAPRRAAFAWRLLFVLAAALAVAMPAVAGTAIVEPRTGQLIVGATDLAVPAGGVLLELRRTASSADEGGGLLGPRWRLDLEKRVPPATAGTSRDLETGREVYRPDGRLMRIEMRNRGAVALSYDDARREVRLTDVVGAITFTTRKADGREESTLGPS